MRKGLSSNDEDFFAGIVELIVAQDTGYGRVLKEDLVVATLVAYGVNFVFLYFKISNYGVSIVIFRFSYRNIHYPARSIC